MLLVARLLLGLTIGVSIVVVPVFVAESAPTAVRGALLVAYQVATVVGIVLGYLAAYALAGAGNWRLMLGLAAVPALALLGVVVRLPDTPRWYVMRGRLDDARRTLTRIEPGGGSDAEIDAEIADMRRALLPAVVRVASLAAVFVSLVLVDRVGRRPVLLGGIGTMVAANALLVAVFLSGAGFGGWQTAAGFLGVMLFSVGFTFGVRRAGVGVRRGELPRAAARARLQPC